MTTAQESGRIAAGAPHPTAHGTAHGSAPGSAPGTARLTGLAYLGLAIAALGSVMVIRSRLYVPGDAAATAANLVAHEGLARLGIAADLATVLTQALAAVWFFKLFRSVDGFAAGTLAAFGLVNATIILVGTAFSAAALDVALAGDAAATTLLLYDLSATAWNVGALFFGLWLIPMGRLALRSGTMPRPLGWILIAGGVGYIVSTFTRYLAPDASVVTDGLVIPATVGELWMVGYLLVKGAAADPTGAPGADAPAVAGR